MALGLLIETINERQAEIADLKRQLAEAKTDAKHAWENRDRFCEAINDIARLVMPEPHKDCYDPGAVLRNVREQLAESREREDKLRGLMSDTIGWLGMHSRMTIAEITKRLESALQQTESDAG